MHGTSENQLNAFEHSVFLKLLNEAKEKHLPLRIAFLEYNDSDNQLHSIIKKLKNSQYVVLLNTVDHAKTELNTEVEGAASSINLQAYLRQENNEYMPITEYSEVMKHRADSWRAAIIAMVERLGKKDFVSGLGDIEDVEEVNQAMDSSEFRFTLNFNKNTMGDNENFAKALQECVEQIREFQKKCALAYAYKLRLKKEKAAEHIDNEEIIKLANSGEEFLHAVMDLRIGHDSNLQKNELNVVLTPHRGTKDAYILFMVEETCKRLGIMRNDLDHVLICGDSYADLKSGFGAINSLADPDDPTQYVPSATFFIPSRSSITNVLRRLQNGVEGVKEELDNSSVDQKIFPVSVVQTDSPGHYSYTPARQLLDLNKLRKKIEEEKQISTNSSKKFQSPLAEIIMADEAFSTAQTPVESIQMYLNSKYPST